MPQPNIKIYIVLSGILAIILIVILVFPFNRKTGTTVPTDSPTPTTFDLQPGQTGVVPTVQTSEFTGVEEEVLPDEIVDQATQKQELRHKMPASFTTFSLDFSYSEDKFMVSLSDPKDAALKEFEEWKRDNYPSIPMDQFIFN